MTSLNPDLAEVALSNGPDGVPPVYVGFICAAVAVVFYGSNFVPVKKFETGDGVFFQWILCSAVAVVGLVVQILRGSPQFYPLAMAGGAFWCTGNMLVVPIIKTIGLGQGILIWGTFNLLSGWAAGRFGFMGVTPEIPNNVTLNYIGVFLCVCSAFVTLGLKSESNTRVQEQPDNSDEETPLLVPPAHSNRVTIEDTNVTFLDGLSPNKKRLIGCTGSIISGLLYGINFTPPIYIQDHYPDASQNGLDYVFAHFCGIYITSTFYLLVYSAFMQNQPRIYSRAILPGFISGLMWGIATTCWFVANAVLSEPVAFPIITSGPGVIGAMWGVFWFKEVKGLRNYLLLAVVFTLTVSGAIVTGLSKLEGSNPGNSTLTYW